MCPRARKPHKSEAGLTAQTGEHPTVKQPNQSHWNRHLSLFFHVALQTNEEHLQGGTPNGCRPNGSPQCPSILIGCLLFSYGKHAYNGCNAIRNHNCANGSVQTVHNNTNPSSTRTTNLPNTKSLLTARIRYRCIPLTYHRIRIRPDDRIRPCKTLDETCFANPRRSHHAH